MRRLRVTWDGLGGLPGLSTFYYGVASPNVSDTVALFNAVKAFVPPGIVWTIPSSGDELDSATGTLTGGWVGTGGATVTATGGGTQYAAGTGAIMNWETGVVHNGRRIKGRTFLCPLVTGAYTASGGISSTYLTPLQTAMNAWVASGVAKGIWSKGRFPGDGVYAAINAGVAPSRTTSLRSRRY